MSRQPELFDVGFETARPANPIFAHQEFLEKLQEHRNQPIGKRASLLLQRLAVDERRQHYKPTHGPNRGWRRSRLGGSGGSHFYAWWAPKSAPPFRDAEGFSDAPDGSIILRDIRHHDDHSVATPQSFGDQYLPVSVAEIRKDEYGPSPWTQPQMRFAGARNAVRILKGHPGSGKTTALLHAADATGAERVLYVTYSPDLATLARQYFERYCSRHKTFHVVTFQTLVRQLLGEDAPLHSEADLRKKFQSDVYPFLRSLAPWHEHPAALYDEVHAHLVGAALPRAIGRFAQCAKPRVPDKNYRERRIQHLGQVAAVAALDAAARLEKLEQRTLAERYFPELYLAWKVAERVNAPAPSVPSEFLEFDCIAVDECQDLTPLESFIPVQLAATINARRRIAIPLLMAGDEAQTVRPTDFEWGWLSDLLHRQAGTPTEFKLTANLRSPRRIADLVNRVWDLYSHLDKRDRPSGASYAEVDDDATDEVLYCSAAPGDELNALLQSLAAREGLAMISLDDAIPMAIPAELRPSILNASEAKGLDFHSVCLIDGGRQLDRIVKLQEETRMFAGDIESLRKRLAIDRLRVAVSRPTERLVWVDINPTPKTVQNALLFLNGPLIDVAVSPSIPSALMRTLDEEQFDIEERIRLCLEDARQYLQVRPELAWSRARQALTLLGDLTSPACVTDPSVRFGTYRSVTEISFTLAMRNVRLPPELGHLDLFREAHGSAVFAGVKDLAPAIEAIGAVMRASAENRLTALGYLAQKVRHRTEPLEPWLLTEIGSKATFWVDELEAAMSQGRNAAILAEVLPPLYDALALPDAEARKERLRKRSVQLLIKNGGYRDALSLLQALPERDYKLEGLCLENLNQHAEAADAYRKAGDLKEALKCYRSVPDFDTALALVRDMPDHPAADSYEWLNKLRALIAEKPEKFNRVMLAPEKKVLEGLLEDALGVARKKPAVKKAVTKKAVVKKAPVKRRPMPPF